MLSYRGEQSKERPYNVQWLRFIPRKTDQFLRIAHGTAAEVAKAKDIIETTHPTKFSLHSGEAKAAAAV